MKFNKPPKFITQGGSVLLLCITLNTTPITASTIPSNTFKQTDIKNNDEKILNLLGGNFNWSKLSEDEKKQLKSELKKLVPELKKTNQEFKKEFGKEPFSNDFINKVTHFANNPEKIDAKEMESLIGELFTSAFEVIAKALDGENNPFKALFSSEQKNPLEGLFSNISINGLTPKPTTVTKTVTTTSNNSSKKKKSAPAKKYAYYTLTADMISVSPIPYNNGNPNSYIKSVVREKDATKVTFVNAIHFPSNWSQFSSSAYLRDIETDKRYYPISMEKNIPLDSLLVTNGHARQMVEFTLIYPSLDKGAKELLFCNKSSEKIERPTNASVRQNALIKLEQFTPVKKDLIIRELLNGKFALCNSKGYWISSSNFDRIETIKVKDKLFKSKLLYWCYTGGNIQVYSSNGVKME